MKKILLAVVLGGTVVAVAQSNAQPAQGQSSAPAAQPTAPAPGQSSAPAAPSAAPAQAQPSAQPVIKDPAEYNAYVAAVDPKKDANARISALEAFLTQYPNSVMKNQALEVLMGTYQQAGNTKKTLETAAKLVASDSCNMRALALLAYLDRVIAQGGDANAAQLLEDGKKYGQQGLDCEPKITDAEMLKMKDQMTGIFKAAIGLACLQAKDYACASANLRVAADGNPTDFSVVYPLTLSYWPDAKIPTTPDNSVNAIWYAVRASAIAPAASQAGIEKYARSLYIRFHGGEDGWADLLAKAKAGTAAPADLVATIKAAPTPAEQAHDFVSKTPPDKMDFAIWEFALANGSQADQDTVWTAIKGKPVPDMTGLVISITPAPCPAKPKTAVKSKKEEVCTQQIMIAGSGDDIDDKKPDITLNFEDTLTGNMVPKEGANMNFRGEPSSYTPSPFMMVMDKGKILLTKPAPKAAGSGSKKSTTHKSSQ